MSYGRLPGVAESAGGTPVASTEEALARQLALVVGVVDGRLAVWDPADRAAPLSVEWAAGRQGYRLAAERVRHERLVKALGRVQRQPAMVLDLTAGLGRDAALMAGAGFPVTMVERQPLLHALLADALVRAAATPLARQLTLLPAGEAEGLALPAGPWHAVYLDPMFPARDKSAAVKRDLQWLQRLCRYPDAAEEAQLLALARRQKADKVVVKRPRRAPPLASVEPHHCIEGKTVRFDVYVG